MEYDVETRLRTPKKYNRRTDLISNITNQRDSQYSIFKSNFLSEQQVKKLKVYEQNQQLTQDSDEINQAKHWERLRAREDMQIKNVFQAQILGLPKVQQLECVRIAHQPHNSVFPIQYVRGKKRYRISPVLPQIQ